MNELASFQLAVNKVRDVQLKNLKRDNAVLRARLAWLKTFADIPLADYKRIDEILRVRVRGTPEAYTLGQRGATPRPATN